LRGSFLLSSMDLRRWAPTPTAESSLARKTGAALVARTAARRIGVSLCCLKQRQHFKALFHERTQVFRADAFARAVVEQPVRAAFDLQLGVGLEKSKGVLGERQADGRLVAAA